jgi:prepilin-type N-terminal cleavage/methylation domain-containing protein
VNLKQPYGFTLVELVVVMVLMAILLTFSLPAFKKIGLFKNQAEGSRYLARLITLTKHRALKENRDLFLHLDIDDDRIWITDKDMDAPALENARSEATALSKNLRITGMEFAGTSRHVRTDTLENQSDRIIRFNRNGYSDGVILHLTDSGSPVSLKVAPFLMEVDTFFKNVSFDDCP